MNSHVNPSLPAITDSWRVEVRDLETCVDELREWMKEVNQFGIPHFGETATRLRPLGESLVRHFKRDAELVSQFASSLPEVDELRRQSTQDNKLLLAELSDLSSRLSELEPPFESWQAAMNDVELFTNRLVQHEESQSQRMERFRRNPR